MTNHSTAILNKYPLGDNLEERERLVGQYATVKKFIGWTSATPRSVDVHKLTNVIDIAAGTGVWALDFTSEPEVKPRVASGEMNVYACDMTLTKFPPKEFMDEIGVKIFEQDITQPFPESMCGTFDLIHMAIVAIALAEEGWEKTLANCYDLLKPGGTLWLIDSDLVYHKKEETLSMIVEQGHDLEAMKNGTTWRHKYNCIYSELAAINGTLPDLSFRMPYLLEKASLRPAFHQRYTGPLGKACQEFPAIADEEVRSARNAAAVFDALTSTLFKKGILEAPLGTRIATEDDRKALVEEMSEGVRQEGAWVLFFEYLATK